MCSISLTSASTGFSSSTRTSARRLYQYLFHEYILTQGAFALAPNPYWMQIKTAYSFVRGDLLTAIMGPGGRLMAWAGHPWASWDTPEGDQEAILTLLRRAVALRRGPARDFLVFGRLLRPLPVGEVEQVTWMCEGRLHTIPAVLHARWRAVGGRTALALANWTAEERIVELESLPVSGGPARFYLQSDTLEVSERGVDPDRPVRLALPPLSVALVEWSEEETA